MADTAFVLIVEDEAAHGEAMAEALRRSDFVCHVVEDGKAAVESLDHHAPDVVISDYKLGGKVNGMDVLRHAKTVSPETEVILITAYGSEDLAREALSRDGKTTAYDYLIKPIDIDVLREKVKRAARKALSARESRMIREQEGARRMFEKLGFSAEALLTDWAIDRSGNTRDLVIMSYDVTALTN